MTAPCVTCGREVQRPNEAGNCLPCERQAESMARWRAGVEAPKCPCGKPLTRCDECAAMHCTAPGHLVHACAVEVSHDAR